MFAKGKLIINEINVEYTTIKVVVHLCIDSLPVVYNLKRSIQKALFRIFKIINNIIYLKGIAFPLEFSPILPQ